MKRIKYFVSTPLVLLTCAVFGFAFVASHTRFALPSAAVQSPSGDIIWVEDALQAGATAARDNEG